MHLLITLPLVFIEISSDDGAANVTNTSRDRLHYAFMRKEIEKKKSERYT